MRAKIKLNELNGIRKDAGGSTACGHHVAYVRAKHLNKINENGIPKDAGGSTAYGHYVAYVRAAGGRWFLCDDSRVVEVGYGLI